MVLDHPHILVQPVNLLSLTQIPIPLYEYLWLPKRLIFPRTSSPLAAGGGAVQQPGKKPLSEKEVPNKTTAQVTVHMEDRHHREQHMMDVSNEDVGGKRPVLGHHPGDEVGREGMSPPAAQLSRIKV